MPVRPLKSDCYGYLMRRLAGRASNVVFFPALILSGSRLLGRGIERGGANRDDPLMDLVASLPAFVVAVVLISASPGPAMALIMRRAALRGFAGAVPTASGRCSPPQVWQPWLPLRKQRSLSSG